MIEKIEKGKIYVKKYGLPAGIYSISRLTLEELVAERNLLHIKYFNDVNQKEKIGTLIEEISKLIDNKCNE